MTITEKILAEHSGMKKVHPGEIVDVMIDLRLARDFGGAGVVKNLQEYNLSVKDASKTFFTFDCNPTGSDQQYATNQQKCRLYARSNNIKVFDIDTGIGTHLAIDEGLAMPGSTLISTDSHANILGAIGAFGQGMGDKDIAAAWAHGSVWFKVPPSIKLILKGIRSDTLSAKDIILNLLTKFGADGFLGYAVEIYGEEAEAMSLDERITIASMATEAGAVCILFPPSVEVINFCKSRSYQPVSPVFAEPDAKYEEVHEMDLSQMQSVVALPGQPHNTVPVDKVKGIKIDSAFIGSCTNGRMEDLRKAASILKGKKVAPGVVMKIVPSTDAIWKQCLKEGLIDIFKSSGALFGNAGCAGCASGQIGQNGPGEITISTGNRNFTGKQGKGDVYLASPEIAAASAIAGHITDPFHIPEHPSLFMVSGSGKKPSSEKTVKVAHRNTMIEGKVWLIMQDNIDTDMIYHNRHLAVTDIQEMGQYALGNMKGWEDYARKSEPGDIIITGKNFGAGSSRQQAVDCFKSLKNQAILANSFGVIYERNAINAGFPVLTYVNLAELNLKDRDTVVIDLKEGKITNKENGKSVTISKFSDVQQKIYEKGDILI